MLEGETQFVQEAIELVVDTWSRTIDDVRGSEWAEPVGRALGTATVAASKVTLLLLHRQVGALADAAAERQYEVLNSDTDAYALRYRDRLGFLPGAPATTMPPVHVLDGYPYWLVSERRRAAAHRMTASNLDLACRIAEVTLMTLALLRDGHENEATYVIAHVIALVALAKLVLSRVSAAEAQALELNADSTVKQLMKLCDGTGQAN